MNENSCENLKNLYSDYLNSGLNVKETMKVDAHLTQCQECTSLVEELRQTVALTSNLPEMDTAFDFMARLHARLDEVELVREPVQSRRAWLSLLWPPKLLPTMGVGFAAIILGLVIYNRPVQAPQQNIVVTKVERPSDRVVLSADSPLEDPVAANLEEHYSDVSTEKTSTNANL